MDEKIKTLAHKTVDKIYRKVRKANLTEFNKLGNNVGVGADGDPPHMILSSIINRITLMIAYHISLSILSRGL